MRQRFIYIWSGLVLLTFLIAFIFRSQTIEADIEQRVAQDLRDAGLGGADVVTNGRFVTISGVVPSQEQKNLYLKTADATYGALGPTDDLRVLSAAGSYVSAVKQGGELSMRGTVPSQDMFDALEAAASDFDGVSSVSNELEVFELAEPWYGDLEGALKHLSALDHGQLTVSAKGGTLFGRGSADAAAQAQNYQPQTIENWTSLVTPDGEIDTLRADLGNAQTQTQVQADQLREATEQLEGVKRDHASELSAALAARNDFEAQAASLSLQTGELAARLESQNNRVLGFMKDDRAANNAMALLTSNLENSDARLSSMQAEVAALTAQRDDAQAQAAAAMERLNDTTSEHEAAQVKATAELEGLRAANSQLSQDLADMQDEVQTINSANADAAQTMEADLAERDGALAERDAKLAEGDVKLAELEATLLERDNQLADLSAQLSDSQAQAQADLTMAQTQASSTANDLAGALARIAALETQRSDLAGRLDGQNNRVMSLMSSNSGTNAELEVIQTKITDRNVRIGTLEADLADAQSANEVTAAELSEISSQRDDIAAQRDVLLAERETLTGENADLLARLDAENAKTASLMTSNAQTSDQVQALKDQLDTAQQDVAGLSTRLGEIDSLRADVTSKEDEIARLSGSLETANARAKQVDLVQAQLDVAQQEIADLKASLETANARSGQNDALMRDLEKRTAEVADLEAQLQALQSKHGAAQDELVQIKESQSQSSSAMEQAQVDLTAKTASLLALQSQMAAMTTERDGALETANVSRSSLQDMEARVEALTQERDASVTRLQVLEDELSLLSEKEAAVQNTANAQSDVIARLQSERDELAQTHEQMNARLSEREASHSKVVDQNRSLNAQIKTLQDDLKLANNAAEEKRLELGNLSQSAEVKLASLQAELDASLQEKQAVAADLSAATRQLEQTAQKHTELEGQIAGLQVSVEGGDAKIADLTKTVETLNGDNTQLSDAMADLTAQKVEELEMRDAQILQLTALLDERKASDAADAEAISANQAELERTKSAVSSLVAERDRLKAVIDERSTALDESEALVASLQSQNVQGQSTIADLTGQLAQTQSQIAQRCSALANLELEKSKINFASGTNALLRESEVVLERISGIAMACVNEDTLIEIGGHTDSRGGDDANQKLSIARATTVRDFLIERGVPEGNLGAIGYGETQPIADNATDAGRAENRRISLEWQQR
jgi:outer membrane protein OmpA-like peptidoglycan-associated protein